MKVNITARANVDVRDIALFIARKSGSKKIAVQVLTQIGESVIHIADMPEIGHAGRRKNTRELVVPRLPYIIVYQIGNKRIDILAVTHGARNG